MERMGTDFNTTGSVMNRSDLEELRRKRGECVTCGQKCYRKKLFKMVPIDDPGRVLNGRCLNCYPLNTEDAVKEGVVLPAASRPATRADLVNFTRSQSNLQLRGPGMMPRRVLMASHSGSEVTGSSSGPAMLQRGVPVSSRSMPPRTPGQSGRSMGNRSLSLMVAATSSLEHSARSMQSMQSMQSASTASVDGSESQALPSPPPPSEPPHMKIPGVPTRTVSGSSATGAGLNNGSGHHSVDGSASISSQPSERGASGSQSQTRLFKGGSQRRITATRSGQSLRSTDSSIMEDAPNESNAEAEDVSEEDTEGKTTSGELRRATTETVLVTETGELHDHEFQHIRDSHNEVQKQIQQYAKEEQLAAGPRYQHSQHIEYEQQLVNHTGSNRSLRSASTLGDRSNGDGDEFDGPRHGVLDRGGEFAFKINGGSNRPVGTHIVSGSSRTLSSMSSIEEDQVHVNGQTSRQQSKKRLSVVIPSNSVEALYEQADECSTSIHSRTSATPSHTSSRNASARNALDPEHLPEQELVDRIRMAGQVIDYREILMVLREAMNYPIVVKEAFEELSCLQLNAEDHDNLSDLGAPHLIADAMQAHVRLIEVQLWGCGAIWNMTGTVRSQLAFVDAGALDLILAAMDNFIDTIDVQEKAIATLSNLGAAEDNLAILIDKGAVGRIVEAMNKHSEIGSVQIKGCSAVTNFASHVSPLKRRLMDLGGGGAVVICMVMHPEDFYLQEKALRALRNLCANSEENKVELANIGGIDAVISAMQVHRDEAGVQEEGAWTLSNLAGNDENKAVIGDCGGIDVIIRAMWVHSDNVGVQEWCCRALFTLTIDTHNGNIVLDVGGISAVVNAMQAHVDSPAVQEMGCAVLGNLAGTDASKMRIVDEEALDAIVLAMVLHGDDAQLQERACMVLMRLAIVENHKSMHAANIGELVRVAAEKFPEKCEEPARRLLHTLALDSRNQRHNPSNQPRP